VKQKTTIAVPANSIVEYSAGSVSGTFRARISTSREGYLDRKRRAKPSAPRAAPSNNAVVPPSGTLQVVAGITWGVALALWLNASIRAQTAAEASTSLFERVFDFIDVVEQQTLCQNEAFEQNIVSVYLLMS
jgi:hypothetical protein